PEESPTSILGRRRRAAACSRAPSRTSRTEGSGACTEQNNSIEGMDAGLRFRPSK
ncbi:unnamed protein product, partial [Phaeothamnion confervicola]